MDRMVNLEKRIDQLLSVMQRLKEEKVQLKKDLQVLEKEIGRRDRDSNRWTQERKRLRTRVEQILSETGRFLQKPGVPSGERWQKQRGDWEARKGGDA